MKNKKEEKKGLKPAKGKLVSALFAAHLQGLTQVLTQVGGPTEESRENEKERKTLLLKEEEGREKQRKEKGKKFCFTCGRLRTHGFKVRESLVIGAFPDFYYRGKREKVKRLTQVLTQLRGQIEKNRGSI